jgi:hypothetical protein
MTSGENTDSDSQEEQQPWTYSPTSPTYDTMHTDYLARTELPSMTPMLRASAAAGQRQSSFLRALDARVRKCERQAAEQGECVSALEQASKDLAARMQPPAAHRVYNPRKVVAETFAGTQAGRARRFLDELDLAFVLNPTMSTAQRLALAAVNMSGVAKDWVLRDGAPAQRWATWEAFTADFLARFEHRVHFGASRMRHLPA